MKPVIHPSAVCYLAQALIKMVAAQGGCHSLQWSTVIIAVETVDYWVDDGNVSASATIFPHFCTLLQTHTHSHMWFSTPVWENTMKGIDSDEWCWFRGPGNLVPVWVLGRQWSLYFACLCCRMRKNRTMWGGLKFLFRCWRWIIFAIGV